jgi:hypothetical protein
MSQPGSALDVGTDRLPTAVKDADPAEMIVSFAKNFIFLKTRKTGGTTVEIALTPSCGPDDILAPITFGDELLRLRDGKLAARNFVGDRTLEADIAEAVLARQEDEFYRLKRLAGRQGAFRNHMTATEVRERVPRRFWDSAFKFTVERHPYEKVVSRAYWDSRKAAGSDIAELIESAIADLDDGRAVYVIDDAVAVDQVLRLENLDDDLKAVADRLALSLPAMLPRAKGSFRTDRRPAREILSERQKRAIFERQRETFALMGYEP